MADHEVGSELGDNFVDLEQNQAIDRCYVKDNPNDNPWHVSLDPFIPLLPDGSDPIQIRRALERTNLRLKLLNDILRPGGVPRPIYTSNVRIGPDNYDGDTSVNPSYGDITHVDGTTYIDGDTYIDNLTTYGGTVAPIRLAKVATTIAPSSTTGTAHILGLDGEFEATATVIIENTNTNYLLPGEWAEVFYDKASDSWLTVGSRGLIRRGVLTGTITHGSSGTVNLRRDGANISPTVSITAFNRQTGMSLYAEQFVTCAWMAQEASLDSNGIRTGKWVIIAVNSAPAPKIYFELDSTLLTTNATATISILDYFNGDDPELNGSITSINNPRVAAASTYLFEGAVSDRGFAFYDQIDNDYTIFQMEC